jgi:hypothetical protein
MKPAGASFTVFIRRIDSGARVTAFQTDDLNHAYSMATVIIRSPEYCRCYAVATDWQGTVCFNVQPQVRAPAPYQAPAPGYAPQLQQVPAYARPAYAPQALPARQNVIDAVIEED